MFSIQLRKPYLINGETKSAPSNRSFLMCRPNGVGKDKDDIARRQNGVQIQLRNLCRQTSTRRRVSFDLLCSKAVMKLMKAIGKMAGKDHLFLPPLSLQASVAATDSNFQYRHYHQSASLTTEDVDCFRKNSCSATD